MISFFLANSLSSETVRIVKSIFGAFSLTSTGFSTAGAQAQDIELFKRILAAEKQIKASGGIRDYKTAINMIEAGADRLGTSSGIAIINESKNQ